MKRTAVWLLNTLIVLSCSRSGDETASTSPPKSSEKGNNASTSAILSRVAAEPPETIEQPPHEAPPLEDEQRRLLNKTIMKYQRRWYEASNDIKRTAIFDEMKAFEKDLFKQTTTVENWRGTLSNMSKQDFGNDICLMVDLGEYMDSVGVSQGCQGSLLSSDPDGIKKGTLVYKQLGKIVDSNSDLICVQFSGTITSKLGDEEDEMVAMHRPSYTMTFTNIEKCPKKKKGR